MSLLRKLGSRDKLLTVFAASGDAPFRRLDGWPLRFGGLDLHEKRGPGEAPAPLVPWFAYPGRRSADTTIVFGHWATLRAVEDIDAVRQAHRVRPVDTGCVWGGPLTALRLDDDVEIQVRGAEKQ